MGTPCFENDGANSLNDIPRAVQNGNPTDTPVDMTRIQTPVVDLQAQTAELCQRKLLPQFDVTEQFGGGGKASPPPPEASPTATPPEASAPPPQPGTAADAAGPYDASGKPVENVCWQTADGGTQYWENGALKTVWNDNTLRVEYPDGRGFVVRSDGSKHSWGPYDADNFEITADGGFQKFDPDTFRIVTTWPDGTVREEDPLGGIGFVKKPDGSRHQWGPNDDDNFDETPTADGGIKRTYSDGGWYTRYPDGRLVEPLPDGSGTREWIPGGPNNYTIRVHSGNRLRDIIASGDPTLADSPPHMRRQSWSDFEERDRLIYQ